MIRASLLALLFALPAHAESTHDGYHDGEPEQGGAEERGEAAPLATEPPMAPPEEADQGGAEERGEATALPPAEAEPEPASEPEQGGAEERSEGVEEPGAGDVAAPEDPAESEAPDAGSAHDPVEQHAATHADEAPLAVPVDGPESEEGGHEERGEHVPVAAVARPAADPGQVGGTMALLLLLIGGGFGVAHAVRQQFDA